MPSFVNSLFAVTILALISISAAHPFSIARSVLDPKVSLSYKQVRRFSIVVFDFANYSDRAPNRHTFVRPLLASRATVATSTSLQILPRVETTQYIPSFGSSKLEKIPPMLPFPYGFRADQEARQHQLPWEKMDHAWSTPTPSRLGSTNGHGTMKSICCTWINQYRRVSVMIR